MDEVMKSAGHALDVSRQLGKYSRGFMFESSTGHGTGHTETKTYDSWVLLTGFVGELRHWLFGQDRLEIAPK